MTGEDAPRYIDGPLVQIAHVHPVRRYLWLARFLFSPRGHSVSSETGQACQKTPGIKPPFRGQIGNPSLFIVVANRNGLCPTSTRPKLPEHWNAVTALEAVQMSYSDGMDHLEVLREKIGRLRGEIAHIQELNELYRRRNGDATEAQVAHIKRHERLQAIQLELAQLADLGRKVHSVEEMKEKHRHRMHLIKQARAS